MRRFLSLFTVLMLYGVLASAQIQVVTGRVTDENSSPIAGASVQEKNSVKGTTTNATGDFTLSTTTGKILIISSVGKENVEVVANSSNVTVALKPANQNLTEVVVTSFGIRREKKALGYAVSTVNKEQLELRPEGDLARVLNGKVPGLNILNSSGLSGSGTNIVVRAISTVTGSSQPLFIVDGVPFNGNTNTNADFRQGNQTSSRFLDLDPNNIASVSVLKGLSATTLYGEDGHNGVILVTTKNGSSGSIKKKAEVTVAQSFFSSKAFLPDYQQDYGGGFQQAEGVVFYSNWGAKITNPPHITAHPYDKGIYALAFPQYQKAPYEYKAYPSVKNFFRDGLVSNTSVNVGGGSENASYNASYSYLDDKGVTPGNRMYRNTFGMGGTAKLTNNFSLTGSFNFTKTNVKSPPTATSQGSGSANGPAIFGDVMYTPLTIDLTNLPFQNPLDGSSVYYRNNNSIQNPYWTVAHSFTEDNVNRVFGNLQMKYNFTPKLSLLYRVGYDNYSEFQLYAQDKGGIPGAPFQTGVLRTANGINNIWDHTLFGNYNTKLSKDWSLNLDIGVNSKKTEYSQTGVTSTSQVVFGLLDHSNFDTHSSNSEGGSDFDLDYKSTMLSLGAYIQSQFGYKEFLFVNLGGRNSWASTVEKQNRSIFYPSGSVSFIPTSAFTGLRGNSIVNYLKLRAGYATSADFPSPYNTRSALSVNTRSFLTSDFAPVNTLSINNRLANPDLKPELIRELETGIEGNFFHKKVNMDLTLYKRISKDQLLDKQLDPATGYTSQTVNAGNVTNKGIELLLGYTIIQNKSWRWHIDGIYNINKSKVSDIPAALGAVQIAGFSNLGIFAINGQPLGVIQGNYVSRYQKKDGSGNPVAAPGNGQRIVNTIGDYSISGDIGIIGDPSPKYKMTAINSLGFKGFTFNMQWEFTEGGDMYANTPSVLYGRGVVGNGKIDRNVFVVLPGVLEDGTPNTIQTTLTDAVFDNSVAGAGAADLSVYDATVVRLRELSLSYQFPESLLRKLPFGSVSFSVSGQNLWYYAPNFPKDTNFDPEANGLGVSNGRGLEFFSGPSTRRIGGSIKITF
ncbi:MAG: SusC/RagA family TonB-linked outer membrane protein [Ginsengibacter sp.]